MSQNTTTTETVQETVHHSKPIPISTHHLRNRSTSLSSESSNSPNPSPPLLTPKNFPNTRMPNSPSSPIFHFLSQSPTKTSATFPFRGFAPPLPEDESADDRALRPHARRASITGRFQPQLPTPPENQHERGVNLLRRLSLGSSFGKPPVTDTSTAPVPKTPPNSALPRSPNSDGNNIPPTRKSRRSATVTEQARPRRAPSPMGERILKGHFDGFN